jgi:hypothetical protein
VARRRGEHHVVVLRILTGEYWILDLDRPVRVGDTVEWWVEEVTSEVVILDGVLPVQHLRELWSLEGVNTDEYDVDEIGQIARGTVFAIEELRSALRPVVTPMVNCWEPVPRSGRLIERFALDPTVAESFNPDDSYSGYLVTLDGSVSTITPEA